MIGQLLYICGAPGVGKSTLARELRTGWDLQAHRGVPVPHIRLTHPGSGRWAGLELGALRDSFSGTDALSMDIGPRAMQWLRAVEVPFGMGEGSRLATRPFLGGLAQAGVQLTLVRLVADEDLLTERWRARGSKQNPVWRKGAGTRADRISDWFLDQTSRSVPGFRTYLDLDVTEESPGRVADRVREAFPLIDLRGWAT